MHAPLRSNLRSPTTMDVDAIKRHGFHDQGILVISVEDPRLGWHERELLRQIGQRMYGRGRPARDADRA